MIPPLPDAIILIFAPFAPLVSARVWRHAQVWLLGAVLTPGSRTVTGALRVMGLALERQFTNDHRVLNRAAWSSLAASRLLLGVLVAACAPTGGLVRGLDDHIERRRGEKNSSKSESLLLSE